VQTRTSAALFTLKTAVLGARRRVDDVWAPLPLGARADVARMRPIGSSVTPLFARDAGVEARLQAGKVQNLRIAARSIDGRGFGAGEVFSFWRHVGRPTRRRGFTVGREVREGCLVPSIGGGLCQLSNALYDAALDAGMTIVERHAHSVVVPGSLAEIGRDATVFYNHVDLRFAADHPFAIEARLTERELCVRLFGRGRRIVSVPRVDPRPAPTGSCVSCARSECPSNAPALAAEPAGRASFLVDRVSEEHARWVNEARREGDRILLPLDGARWGRARYAWPTAGFARVHEAIVPAMMRALASRRLAKQGAARQHALLAHDEALARWMADRLGPDDAHLVIAQNLLPFLWRDGMLGGRTFDVLATRLPLSRLHQRLDQARARYPESRTLGDFRADRALIALEDEALARARRVVTAHSEIADLFGARGVHLAWSVEPGPPREGDRIVFLGPVVGRRGVHVLRDAMRARDARWVIAGEDLEGDFRWGVPTERAGADPLERAALVVAPAWVEHEPRALLRAVARGVPVIASAACGLRGVRGVTTVPTGDVDALGALLDRWLPARDRSS
jgi:glycosyltransferase involved in cell wall biosynthesis